MIVRELVTRLGFAVNDSQLTKYQRGTDNIKRSAEGAADAFRNMFLAFAGFSALKSIANTADQMQSLQARIGVLPQTITDASTAFDVVADRATKARASIEAYGSFYVKLQNAGKKYITTQEEGLQVTDTITKALVVGGATAMEQSSALLQFGQAIGSGVFQGDEFRAMAEAAPQFMDALAESLGHPREALKKLASEGKLTAKEVIAAVKKMSSVFDEKFKQMPITIGQATTIIGNRWAVFVNRLNRESGTVTKVADFLLSAFDKIEEGLDKFVKSVGGSEQAIKLVAIAITALLLPAMAKLALGFVAFLVSPLGLAIAALFLLGLAIEDVYQWMTGGSSVIGRWLGDFQAFVNELNGGILGKIWGFVTKVGAFFVDVIPFATIWTGIKMIFSGLLSVVTGVIQTIIGIFEILFGVLTADWDMVWNGVKDAIGGIGELLVGLGGILLGAFGLALTAIVTLFKGAFIALGAFIYETIWGNIKKAVSWLSSVPGFGGSMPATVTPGTAAGAASAPSGVPTAGNTSNITINQELPPGTPEQTQRAAREGTTQALAGNPWENKARQMGQAQ